MSDSPCGQPVVGRVEPGGDFTADGVLTSSTLMSLQRIGNNQSPLPLPRLVFQPSGMAILFLAALMRSEKMRPSSANRIGGYRQPKCTSPSAHIRADCIDLRAETALSDSRQPAAVLKTCAGCDNVLDCVGSARDAEFHAHVARSLPSGYRGSM